ncbi:MAG: UDP-glucose 4-epimerase GalE [Cyanobacteria bacterium RI_101]|nr:UDP-glucose 4-epimerase GalE [Cyanobacteria bacterium RI_101]
MTKPTILVTGGAGYIGSHTVLALQEKGFQCVILDNLTYGHQDLVETVLKAPLIIGNINDRQLLEKIFSQYPISAIIHFAAYAYVGESVKAPLKYYQNNLVSTLTLLETALAQGVQKIVFSSTCATYGNPQSIPILESHPQNPINPYGASKLAIERILQDFDTAYGLKSVIFRYFNAAGADPDGRLGEDHDPEPHLIPQVLYTALGRQSQINIFGTDYPTPDGACIRDYIHVSDLAAAHVLGLEYLLRENTSNIFNLGNGNGFSVKEIIDSARRVTGQAIPTQECPRRPGDPAILVGGNQKAKETLGWIPRYPDIDVIISHAWQWHRRRHS